MSTHRAMDQQAHADKNQPSPPAGTDPTRSIDVYPLEALDAMPDLVYAFDSNGRFLYWNRALVARSGYDDEEVATMTPEAFFPADELPAIREAILQAWTEGSATVEAHILTKDQKRLPFEFSSSLLRDEAGAPIALCGAGRDLSERRQYEAALRESERRFRTLFESSRDAMMILGDDGKFAACNPAAVTMFRCASEEEFRRFGPLDLSPERQSDGQRSVDAAEVVIEKTLREGSHSFEWVHRCTDNTEFEASVLLTRLDVGGSAQLHATVRDISVEKAVQEALRANEQKLRTITESALDAIIMIDAQGHIVHWNPAATEMFGYSPDQIMGANPHDLLVPPHARAAANRGFKAFTDSGMGSAIGRVLELTAIHKSGKSFPVEISVSSVRCDRGWGAVAVIRDVSDRKRLEQTLKKQAAELKDRVKELKCLEQLAVVFEEGDLAPMDMVRRVVSLLPTGMRFSEEAVARITFNGEEFCTGNYRDTPTRLTAPLEIDGDSVGTIDICYLQPEIGAETDAFLDEEHSLIRQIAARLGRAIERHRSHQKITTLNRELEVILAATGTRLLLIDQNCIVRYADPATQKYYGTLDQQKCHRYLCLASQRCADCPNETIGETDQNAVSIQKLPAEKDRVFQRTIVPIRVEEGQRLYAELLVDVTDLKAMETDLNQARKLEAVGQLAAGIAHEINTPTQFVGDNTRFLRDSVADLERVLTTLDRLLDAARQGDGTDDIIGEIDKTMAETDADYLRSEMPVSFEQTLDGIGQIATIVRAMKEFSHPGTKSVQWIDLNRAVENTLTVSRSEWKNAAELVTDFEPDLPMVPCFPADLNQAILNIVVNAAHAIEEKGDGFGQIRISTRQTGDFVEVSISDNGCGIPEHVQPHVFDHFFTTKEVGKGTGQGLTIAHAVVVEKHGGSLDFQTESGEGTTFRLRIPLEAASDKQASVAQKP